MAGHQHNPSNNVGREVAAAISRKRPLRLFTNPLARSAERIAGLHKERWRIELFVKWVKQNLRIARFMGATGNAVRIQVATALIACLLIASPRSPCPGRLAQAKLATQHQACTILAIVRGQLFARGPLAFLLDPPPIQRRTPKPRLAFLKARI